MSFSRKESDIVRAFYAADKDGDGSLDLFEYVSLFQQQGVNLSLDDARVAFDEKDRDGDGKISLEEFLGKRTDMEKAWNALDSDRNGFITAKEISNGARKFKKALPRMITFQNGQYFIDRIQERSSGKYSLDDAQARMTSERPITFEDFCAVMKDLEKEDTAWMEPDRSDGSPRHSSSSHNFRKNSEPKSRTSSALVGPRSESVSSVASSDRLPTLNRSVSLQSAPTPRKSHSNKSRSTTVSANVAKNSSMTHFSRYFND